MTIHNNCYLNAGVMGFIAGALAVRSPPGSGTATDYAQLKNSALAFATQLDSKIAFDALVTTANNDPTMLVDTGDHTIQSNTIIRPMLLASIVQGAIAGTFPTSTTAADYDTLATHVAALFTEALLAITSP
jgi:hypothetical protein